MVVGGAPEDAAAPLDLTGPHSSACTLPLARSKRTARVSTSSVAPASSAAGMVVTSIDCLALVGQPMPHEPRFQQPLTLRGIAAAAMPSLAAPRRSRSLFSLGGASHGADGAGALRPARSTAPARRCRSSPGRSARASGRRVATGVRNELVQFTVVEPPTQRPCRMVMALSSVLRPALSWYSEGYASDSCWLKSALLLSGPSSTITTLRPAFVSSSAVMPAPAPEPTMATSHAMRAGTSPCAPPSTFQPRLKPSRIGSCKLLMETFRSSAARDSRAGPRSARRRRRRCQRSRAARDRPAGAG